MSAVAASGGRGGVGAFQPAVESSSGRHRARSFTVEESTSDGYFQEKEISSKEFDATVRRKLSTT
ncbi:hypothetical protein LINPERPRIM_LOCUS6570 [Linum perenne]